MPETATLLSIGPPQTGTLADATDRDVFRIDLAGNATIDISTSGPTDTRGELLDGAGATLASDADSGPQGHNFRITDALGPGAYYAVVSGAAGPYAVSAKLGDAPDHGNTAALSTLLTSTARPTSTAFHRAPCWRPRAG